ncbi:ribonuclease H-like domain-containing protein [Tanacetum coccineum]
MGRNKPLVLDFIDLSSTYTAYLLIYVDDIVLTTSSTALLQKIIFSLHREFDMTDLSIYMHDPHEPHLDALKRILRYFLGTLEFVLQLYASSGSSLVAYSHADWVGFPSTRRSTLGYCVFLRKNLYHGLLSDNPLFHVLMLKLNIWVLLTLLLIDMAAQSSSRTTHTTSDSYSCVL